MENWFDKNKFFEKLLIFTWIIFLFFCLYLLSFTSHAESYFPMGQNDSSQFTTGIINSIDTRYDAEHYYIFCNYGYYNESQNLHYFHMFRALKGSGIPIFAEISSNGYQFSLYTVGNPTITYGYVAMYPDGTYYTAYEDSLSSYQNMYSSIYNSDWCYISNFRLYTNNSDNRQVVLNYGAGDEDDGNENIFLGHATPPDTFEDPVLAQGSNYTLPREVPEAPTINNYTWITYAPPSVDNSTLENLVESLVDIVKYNAGYISTNISNEFNTLIGVIKDSGNYIVKTIQYYVGLVNENIKNGFTNLYDNFVSLFEPALNGIAYLVEPVSGTVIYDNVSETSLVSNINSVNTALTSFKSSFDGLSEPNSFTIPIHLENLPVSYFGVQTTQYIDLGVLGSNEKAIIRTFMWALTTYGLFITIVDSISNYINGGGDET